MIKTILSKEIKQAIYYLYASEVHNIQFQKTRKDFDGDITLVVFPFLKISNKNPQDTAYDIGSFLKDKLDLIVDFNVIKGFLNLSISNDYWFSQFLSIFNINNYGIVKLNRHSPTYLVEYSSPNTNKPLHLGHIRNNLLGYSVAQILKASGKNVKKVQIINDRGIHICKSMVAWKDHANGDNPEIAGIKGDHYVGKYYVEFDRLYKEEVAFLVNSGMKKREAEREAPIFKKAQEMLIRWEKKDPSIIKLWKKMNNWVYDGFSSTYDRLGVSFDKNYYESDTYLLGKKIVEQGLIDGVFYKKEDGSVWIDLSEEGLDEKIILRSDGTAVYMTQDIGTAIKRYEDFNFSHMIYTVGNEQDYHFKVLFLILEKLGYSWGKNCFHLSYGMVDLPSGKMKSREGTVVDADDLIEEMVNKAKDIAKELGKLQAVSSKEAEQLHEKIGIGALKYFMLKVDAKKSMLFDPDESIDFNGNTGPFIQYTYVRIQSLFRKYKEDIFLPKNINITNNEKLIIKRLLDFPAVISESANNYNPSLIANYIYDLVKEYNSYYQSTPILNSEDLHLINYRLSLSKKVGEVIQTGMKLLGIDMPQRM